MKKQILLTVVLRNGGDVIRMVAASDFSFLDNNVDYSIATSACNWILLPKFHSQM